jgi:hypothetical protein
MACRSRLGLQVGSGRGRRSRFQLLFDDAKAPRHRLAEGSFISGSNNPMTLRAWVSIISSSLVLAGATGANVARACSVKGPNRDTSVKLLTG